MKIVIDICAIRHAPETMSQWIIKMWSARMEIFIDIDRWDKDIEPRLFQTRWCGTKAIEDIRSFGIPEGVIPDKNIIYGYASDDLRDEIQIFKTCDGNVEILM